MTNPLALQAPPAVAAVAGATPFDRDVAVWRGVRRRVPDRKP